MSDQNVIDIPADTSLSEAARKAAVGKIIVADPANDKYVVGGDATAAAGNKRGYGYCLDIDRSLTRWTVRIYGVEDEVTIKDSIDVSAAANGAELSFDVNGEIVARANGENPIGTLPDMKDTTGGLKYRVFFDFRRED